jgi:ABC-type sugar transport system ATPase subunit
MAELLKVTDIKKAFAGVQALKGVSLSIAPGEIHCLAGENGCGKSTLIKIISGVYAPDEGKIEFGGHAHSKITPIDAIRNGIQVIYQYFSIFPNLSVMENLAFNTELAAGRRVVNWKRLRKIAEQAIGRINFQVDLSAPLGSLTVADKQMVAISRALLSDARLIIMDEPTTALTRKEVSALFKVILDLKKQDIATLFVSHKLDEVFEISERFTILRSGELVATGSTKELDKKKFTFYMTGREFEDAQFEPKNVSEKPVLEVRNLTLPGSFEDVSFELRRGEIVGVTGLLDSGRTELALSLFGIQKAEKGEILKDGKAVSLVQGVPGTGITPIEDPIEVAANWVGHGARTIHIIDLDGALSGRRKNAYIMEEIVSKFKVDVQVGGGIRDYEAAKHLLSLGIDRVILGTAAIKDPSLVRRLADDIGNDAVMVSLDSRKGEVLIEGWTAGSGQGTVELGRF